MKRKMPSLCFAAIATLFFGGHSVTLAITAPEAVVCDFGTQRVSIIDVTNPSSPQSPVLIPGVAPNNVAITPTATQAWVCNGTTNSVSVIDLSFNTVIATISPLPGAPTSIAIRPDGSEALVVTSAGVTVINVAGQTIETTIGVSGAPKCIAITPNNKQAWVTQNTGNEVTIIDLTSRSIIMNVFLSAGFNPNFIAMTPNSTQSWVTSQGTTTVAAINLVDKSVSTVDIGFNSQFIAITPDSTQVWVGPSSGNSLSIINIADKSVSTVTVGNGSTGLALTPANTQLWEANFLNNNVGIFDRATHNLIQTVLLPGARPLGLAITPDQAPTARFTRAVNGATVTFDGSSSTSPFGGIASYAWNFGDGSPVQTVTVPQISHTYANGGTFTVTLVVTNTQGTSTTQTFTGQTVSNNGDPSLAQTSQQVAISLPPPPLRPAKFMGKSKIHRHNKKLFIKTKWTASSSSNLASYRIAGGHKTRAIIPVRHKRKYALRLHPQNFPRKRISKDYKRYLQHKYSIRAVNASGAVSSPTCLKIDR